jgi:hypothetical protein
VSLGTANGLSLATQALSLAAATSTVTGALTSTDWTTFNNKQATLSAASSTVNGYLTSTNWTTFNGKQDALSAASSTVNGYLTSTNWTTFNNKQDALSAASSTVNGYLTSTNWTTFNNKLSDIVLDTTPQLGGNLDLNQKSLLLDQTPTSDHTANGLIVTGTAGEILAYGNICYYKSDGKFWKADMNASSSASGWLAYSIDTSVAADSSGSFLVKGYARDDSYTWTTGNVLYLGAAGAASSTAPTGSADVVRIVGYAVDGDNMFFNPGNDYLELT